LHKDVFEYLVDNRINCIYDSEKEEISISIVIEDEEYELIMKFPQYYPYTFPEIYIYKNIDFILPHRYVNKRLCLYDENERLPRPEVYLEEALETANRADQLLRDSKNLKNLEDFNKEAVTYWNGRAKGRIDFVCENKSQTRILWGCQLIEEAYIVADNQEKIADFMSHSYGLPTEELKYERVLIVNVGKVQIIGLKTIQDILKLIKGQSDNRTFDRFIASHSKGGLVIINADNGIGSCLFGVKISLVSHGFKINSLNIKGILQANRTNKFTPFSVRDYSMERLFTRGGDGTACFDKRCLLIGCGSVGSFLIKALIDIGITKDIELVDNDIFSEDNIGRHLCGSNAILSNSKVQAVRKALLGQYPMLNCVATNRNALDIFLNDVSYVENHDLICIAVGNAAMEKKIIELIKERWITKECVILWVEPYLVAGHALVFQNEINEKTEENIFDTNGQFNNAVLLDGKKYLKSEAGCQSAYAPYAGFEVQKFVLDFVDCYYRTIYKKADKHNYSFTWLGKLRWARQNDMEIKSEWRAKSDHFIELKRIDI